MSAGQDLPSAPGVVVAGAVAGPSFSARRRRTAVRAQGAPNRNARVHISHHGALRHPRGRMKSMSDPPALRVSTRRGASETSAPAAISLQEASEVRSVAEATQGPPRVHGETCALRNRLRASDVRNVGLSQSQ